ncbi:MAG: hypothetical protein JO311_04980 [Candidatus Eremiobacteraeota bacterium]|nr:hypothetical protein [Candidatus Eremiobacteraeota bacterium]MBV9263767.1 hypothetical protein [Candidatus Eremiobacteraeota bacterium]
MRVGLRTLVPLALCAAAAAAAAAHFVVDVVGDFALSHDSYDHLQHGSRGVVTAIAVVLAGMLALRGLVSCCEIAERDRTRIAAAKFGLAETMAFFVVVLVMAAMLVPSMEFLDARVAGAAFGGIGDAFGGSLLIGLTCIAVCAALAAGSVYALVRWLVSHRESIASMVATLLRHITGARRITSRPLERWNGLTLRRRTLRARQRAKRGPPEILFA